MNTTHNESCRDLGELLLLLVIGLGLPLLILVLSVTFFLREVDDWARCKVECNPHDYMGTMEGCFCLPADKPAYKLELEERAP